MLGGADGIAWGAGLGSGDLGVKRLVIEPCGTIVPGAEAAANGEAAAAGGTVAEEEAGAAAANGEAAGWIELKREFPAEKADWGWAGAGS